MEKNIILMICFVLGLLVCLNVSECLEHEKIEYAATNCLKHTAYLTDFGGVGDGKTPNTAAFVSAISEGKWLTGSFSLISNHFTLYIDKKAVLIASQNESDYPILDPLPSYGQGKDGGKRFSSLIIGTNLTDVVITGGMEQLTWWEKFKKKKLKSESEFYYKLY